MPAINCFVIRAKVTETALKDSRRIRPRYLYFTGNAVKNGNPLYSSSKTQAKLFWKKNEAELMKNCLNERDTIVEEMVF